MQGDSADLAYDAFENNASTHIVTLNTSATGIIIATCSASASVVGSALIVICILRSDRGLGIVYHRIMFGMSCFDFVQSLAMTFTTLPMPTDMLYEQFQGLAAGTTTTCDIQGFTIVFASFCTLMFNAILCIYYLCSIRFKMKDECFSRVMEPLLYLVSIIFCLVIASSGIYYGQFNPSPQTYPWCSHARYPWWCSSDDADCAYERGEYEASLPFEMAANMVVVLCGIVVIVTMIIVSWHVYRQERVLKAVFSSCLSDRNESRLRLYKKNMMHTRDVVISALLYTAVFFVVWHYPFVRIFRGKLAVAPIEEILRLIFRPSQGLLNVIIFVYHKVRNLRSHRPGITLRHALNKAFYAQDDPQYCVSNLTLVGRNHQLRQLNFAFDRDEDDDDCEDSDDSDKPSVQKSERVSDLENESRLKMVLATNALEIANAEFAFQTNDDRTGDNNIAFPPSLSDTNDDFSCQLHSDGSCFAVSAATDSLASETLNKTKYYSCVFLDRN
jgi:hypothetical protein